MKTSFKILVAAFTLLVVGEAQAQQDPLFTHYMFNTLAVNPAYAGSRDALTATAIHRQQWVNLDGAPTTQTLTVHSPIVNDRLGAGLSIINDKAGPLKQTLALLDLSYHLPVNDNAKLAFGLKGGINIMQGSFTGLDLGDGVNDPTFNQNIESDLLPNFGAGLYYYTDDYYVGVSVPKLLENDFEIGTVGNTVSRAAELRHYFLIAGTVFDINEFLKLKPTGFLKYVDGAPVQFDLTTSLVYNDKFSIGAMYRSFGDVGAILGYQFNDQLRASYALDYPLTTLNNYHGWTHEIMLSYDFFFKSQAKIHSPRNF